MPRTWTARCRRKMERLEGKLDKKRHHLALSVECRPFRHAHVFMLNVAYHRITPQPTWRALPTCPPEANRAPLPAKPNLTTHPVFLFLNKSEARYSWVHGCRAASVCCKNRGGISMGWRNRSLVFCVDLCWLCIFLKHPMQMTYVFT